MKFKFNDSITKLILVESTKEEYNQVKRILCPFVHNYRFMQRFKLGVWDGKIDFFKNGFLNFGLWNAVQEICKEYNYPFIIENKALFPMDREITKEKILQFCQEFYADRRLPDKKDSEGNIIETGNQFFPYEHQIDSIFKLLKYRN